MLAETERDAIEVTDDLVTISKTLKDVGKADVAGIEIRVVTDSPVPVAFRLVEQFPEGVSMDDLAVHPQFSPEKWTKSESDRRMAFEDVVEPGEEVVTLYGVLEAKYDGLEPFMGEPVIDVSQPIDPNATSEGTGPLFRGGGTTADDGAIAVDRLLENGGDAPADVDAAESTSAESAGSKPDGAEPADQHPTEAASRPDGDAGSAGEGPSVVPDDGRFVFRQDGSAPAADGPTAPDGATETPAPGDASLDLGNASVVTAFVDELERGEPSEEQLASLREALDLEPAESVRLRVSHLQSEVANLSAYADEFERFVDEEGSPTGVIDEFRSELDRVTTQVADLSADVDAAAEDRAELREYVEELERELAALQEAQETNVGRLSSRIDDVAAESVDAEEAAALREALEAERAWRRKVQRSLATLVEDEADAADGVDRQLEW